MSREIELLVGSMLRFVFLTGTGGRVLCRVPTDSGGVSSSYFVDKRIQFYYLSGAGQDKLGIYIKSVVKGGAADLDGRLRPGDQLLAVDTHCLIGVSQEK